MCFPILGAIASLAGTAMSAVGSIAQGQAQKNAADAQAAALKQQATNELNAGEYQAGRKQDEINKTMSTQVALASSSGFDLTGSPTDAVASTASQGALDTGAIRWNARTAANNDKYQAKLVTQQGKSAQTAGYIGAAASAFSGLSSMGTQLYKIYGTQG